MKIIAYVIRPAEGGMLKHLLDLLGRLDRERFTPIVLSPPGNNLEEPLRRLGVELIEVDIADKPNLARDVGSITRLATALTAVGPNIIHAHSNKATLLVEMAARRASLEARVVFSVHNFPSYRATRGFKKVISSLAMRRVINGADAVIAVSGSLKNSLVENERVNPAKISVVHNGIDGDGFRPVKETDKRRFRTDLGLPEGVPIVGAVGRLVPSKGMDVLIHAAPELVHKFPGLKVVIVGSGPMQQSLRATAAGLGLNRDIIFTGHVDDLRPYYSLFDVFVLPTTLEAFGMTAVEAMLAGCPVVASRTGGLLEIVVNRETGLLVPPGDPSSLAVAIRAQLSDTRTARRMSGRAQTDARLRFSLERMVAETEAIYDTL